MARPLRAVCQMRLPPDRRYSELWVTRVHQGDGENRFWGDKTLSEWVARVTATYQSLRFMCGECTTITFANSSPLTSKVLPTLRWAIIRPAWRILFCTCHIASLRSGTPPATFNFRADRIAESISRRNTYVVGRELKPSMSARQASSPAPSYRATPASTRCRISSRPFSDLPFEPLWLARRRRARFRTCSSPQNRALP
jgi:hypothetical protein